jgi:hypothetical protein
VPGLFLNSAAKVVSVKKHERRFRIMTQEHVILVSPIIIGIVALLVFAFHPDYLPKYLKGKKAERAEERAERKKKLEIVEFFVKNISGDYELLERARKASHTDHVYITLYYEIGGKLVLSGNLEAVKSIFSDAPPPFIVEFSFCGDASFEQTVFVGSHFRGDGGYWSIGHDLGKRGYSKEYVIVDKAGRSVTFFDDQDGCAEVKVLRFIAKYSSVREFLLDKTLEYMRDEMRNSGVLDLCKVVQKWIDYSGAINADLDFEGALQEVD